MANQGNKLSVNNAGLLGTFQYPFYEKFYMKAGLGIALTTVKEKFKKTEFNYRNGFFSETLIDQEKQSTTFASKLGAGYNINENVSTELTYNYLKHLNGLGLEVKYKF